MNACGNYNNICKDGTKVARNLMNTVRPFVVRLLVYTFSVTGFCQPRRI